eukprot:Rhum_TRINITY_DN9596_c0_g2::Rhum_TRINITY_DN9596_c0_g2_i1::g.33961::m.33961
MQQQEMAKIVMKRHLPFAVGFSLSSKRGGSGGERGRCGGKSQRPDRQAYPLGASCSEAREARRYGGGGVNSNTVCSGGVARRSASRSACAACLLVVAQHQVRLRKKHFRVPAVEPQPHPVANRHATRRTTRLGKGPNSRPEAQRHRRIIAPVAARERPGDAEVRPPAHRPAGPPHTNLRRRPLLHRPEPQRRVLRAEEDGACRPPVPGPPPEQRQLQAEARCAQEGVRHRHQLRILLRCVARTQPQPHLGPRTQLVQVAVVLRGGDGAGSGGAVAVGGGRLLRQRSQRRAGDGRRIVAGSIRHETAADGRLRVPEGRGVRKAAAHWCACVCAAMKYRYCSFY